MGARGEVDEGFIKAYAAAQGPLLQFILSMIPRLKDAEDILQETAITLWKKREEFDPSKGSFVAWGCGVARFKVLDHLRKRSPQFTLNEVVSEKLVDIAIQAASDLEARQRRIHALEQCLKKLPDPERLLVEEHYRQLRSIHDIAQSEGKGLSTIYERLQRVRNRLGRCVKRQLEMGAV
ncbi:sigma-70 family RNA polymerase sigma factor [Novipirellula caenicola]|uniref:RNA polymerase sigma-70 region 2 domain-containing protein n=1 Tax=Novipirellula caenicola TaxID=1536901 RepID=A0ABP9VJ30_9BACT